MAFVLVKKNGVNIDYVSVDEINDMGERQVSTASISALPTAKLEINDLVEIVADGVSVDNLKLACRFESVLKDESGNANHGVGSGTIAYQTGKYGKALICNGTNTEVTFTHSASLDFSGATKFTIVMWIKPTLPGSDDKSRVLHKDNAFRIQPFQSVANKNIRFEVHAGGTWHALDSDPNAIDPTTWQMIAVRYDDSQNKMDIFKNTAVIKSGGSFGVITSGTANMLLGGITGSVQYSGDIDTIRIYIGEYKTDTELQKLNSIVRNTKIMLFGGRVDQKDDKIAPRIYKCKGHGKILGEVKPKDTLIYTNKTPEFIIQNLLEVETTLGFVNEATASGLTFEKTTITDFFVDVFSDYVGIMNKTYVVDPLGVFRLRDKGYEVLDRTFTHGSNARIRNSGGNDHQLTNDFTLFGKNIRYRTIELFNGTGAQTTFNLNYVPVSSRVLVGGVEKQPEVDYQIVSEDKQIIFTSAPPSGTNNVSVEYEYEKPIFVRGTKASSQTSFGRRDKRNIQSSIRTYEDGVRYVQNYLEVNKQPVDYITVEISGLDLIVDAGQVVNLFRASPAIDGKFIIKSVTMSYPNPPKTILQMGEFKIDGYDAQRQIVNKVHDLETRLTDNAEIRQYRSPEEIIVIVNDGNYYLPAKQPTESISITNVASARTINQFGLYGIENSAYGVAGYG